MARSATPRAAPPAISAACASTAASAPPTPPAIPAIRSPRCLLRLSPMIPTVPRWQRPSILRVVTAPRTRRARSTTFALRTIACAPPSRHGTPAVRRRHGHHAAGGRPEAGCRPEELNLTDPASSRASMRSMPPQAAASSMQTPSVRQPTSWRAAHTRWKRSSRRALRTASGPVRPTARWRRWTSARWANCWSPTVH